MNTLHFILKSRLKNSKLVQKSGGFTLIELLVALVIAFLILTPLLGFMVNVLTTDQQEQAKASVEDDIQTATNYIARDLQQAIYIYDAAGIAAVASQLLYPSDTTKTPILVFWKRNLVTNVVSSATSGSNDDTFVYSLVAYYLDTSTSTTWSKAARISRWEIKDGVPSIAGVLCEGYTNKYVSGNCPDPGFTPFNDYFTGTDSLSAGMQKWRKGSTSYNTEDAKVLIDFVDQSTSSVPAATCPTNTTATTTTPATTWSQIPATASITGFYACVETVSDSTAQIYIRGNALARTTASSISYSNSNKSYFPTTSIRVQGRGYLYK
ncbi:hormogonium polysaccharide secretion pseudopilin HpsC [Dolichospermum sp. ST_con]|nr:hormogonium polysaccharide secretion pseudopilin HpsC [Dolichospermum sp. ST_con]MDD1419256.1 hormogonium polysaccharide secretion pseudopilin HpsC [Dolichospermum sp. ST_sed1]MDD1424752.1 hormogonium polysaccharide secretion pseudopilin HpsC [Dolichospermum sp. ST_sed9]MDD1432120.1 hormogonium polysaccharide secretion pseudopilin HpsC [Dolichospermum sp. ST_sed6]MDD1436018.1 hormogonium polysaccharide secretion pseudopilin HpsC [Dolichospermum sp. ST_sed10]MDD1440426.1 hormogonium polysacc